MLKKLLLTTVMSALMVLAFAQAQTLFFSEYVEGSSNNKALEIFNGTGATVDLSGYTVKLASNGNTWSTTNSVTLSGTLANNDVFVIANAGANATILGLADLTHTVTYYNGNDALGLFQGETLIDIIGIYQQDPGTAWPVAGTDGATLNHTLIRKPNVTQGNIDWTEASGTTVDNSEWIVHPIDYITDLGMHTFNPGGGEQAATPTFNPPGGAYTQPMHVSIASTTPGATIRYTTDGSAPGTTSTLYTAPIPVSATTTIKAIAYATGFEPSYVASATYTFAVAVVNLEQLRAQNPGDGTVYMITAPVIMTFKQTFRNQKYVQDNAAGVLIDDTAGVITTNYNVGDAIVGLTGTIARYNNMLQLTPVANPGPPASTGNGVFVPVVTIQQVNGNIEMYQSRLVRINNAHFVGASGAFANGTNYNLEDASGTIVFRSTFYDVDYIGTDIPTNNFSLVSIVNQFNQTPQLTARNLADWGAVDNDDYVANPNQTELLGNYPNPFNPKTTIEFNAAKSEPAQITIYNLKGQAVKHFTIDSPAKGINKVTWDGKNDNGIDVASGTYLFRLRSGSYSSTKKMIMMK